MAPDFDNNMYRGALALVFEGSQAPNGLTEGALTRFRRLQKEANGGAARASL